MKPFLVPAFEWLGRRSLHRRGVRSRWVPTVQGKLHVFDVPGTGTLPPVVILHGLSSNGLAFAPVFQRLRRHVRRIVVPDYPGHGQSGNLRPLTSERLIESLDVALAALEVGPAIIVGNSLGGALALHRASAHPEQVLGLVLVSPAGAHATDAEWKELQRAFDIRSRADALAFLARIHYETPPLLALIAHEFPALISTPPVRELVAAASNEHFLGPEALGALRMPILLIWGRAEKLLSEANFEYFRRNLPKHAVIERPETFAHCPHLDNAAALTRRIVAFAEALPAAVV
jgi:pimeloyl-ACP methyl ester carboxylesterase